MAEILRNRHRLLGGNDINNGLGVGKWTVGLG